MERAFLVQIMSRIYDIADSIVIGNNKKALFELGRIHGGLAEYVNTMPCEAGEDPSSAPPMPPLPDEEDPFAE